MPVRIPVEIDGPTARIVLLAQAVQARGDLPDASAKRLVLLAKSVRLFAMARENSEAVKSLSEMTALAEAAADEAPNLSTLVERHVVPLARSLSRM